MKLKTLLLTLFLLAGILSAQTVQQFSGHHYTGTPCSSPSGGVNCAYIAQPQGTTNDPYASYLYITDGGDGIHSTGITFTFDPRSATAPPENLSGTGSAQITFQDGGGNSNTYEVPVWTCTFMGPGTTSFNQYQTGYVENCSGNDVNGNPVSTVKNFLFYKASSRSGTFWQLRDNGADATAQVLYYGPVVPPTPPPQPPPPPPPDDSAIGDRG